MPEQLPTVAAVLARARTLIEGGWTQGAFARDARGFAVEATECDAVTFCMIGAIEKAAGQLWPHEHLLALMVDTEEDAKKVLARDPELADYSLSSYNDAQGRTQAEVLALFDRTLA